jgi:hypothetical protein
MLSYVLGPLFYISTLLLASMYLLYREKKDKETGKRVAIGVVSADGRWGEEDPMQITEKMLWASSCIFLLRNKPF